MVNSDGSDAFALFPRVIAEYERIIKDYSFKTYCLSDYEKVYIIQDSFVLFIGIINYGSRLFPNNLVVFEELLFNNIFKFNFSKFSRLFGEEGRRLLVNKRFHGIWGEPIRCIGYNSYTDSYVGEPNNRALIRSKCYEVMDKIPSLHLRERFDQWDGILHFFIIYELVDGDRKGYAIYDSQNPQIHKVANKMANEVELYALGRYKKVVVSILSIKCDDTMVELLIERIEKHNANGWEHKHKKNVPFERQCIAEHELKYFVVERYARTKGEANRICDEVFDEVHQGKFLDVPRYEYLIPENKWKSEQMVYEIVKRLYKNNTVLYQHRPFFLHTDKGQMSYDIYICGLNVAIEYQGKQHFEPVEIFGGQQHFKNQIYRDKLKRELSEKNGVKLVYINYNEDISPDLIRRKVEEVLK